MALYCTRPRALRALGTRAIYAPLHRSLYNNYYIHCLTPHTQEHRPALSSFERATNGTYPSRCPFSYVTMCLLKNMRLLRRCTY